MDRSLPTAFDVIADQIVRGAGYAGDSAMDMRDELVDHLASTWESEIAAGTSPDIALSRSLASFGSPTRLQLRFLGARLRSGMVRAAALPSWLFGAFAVDVTIGLLWFSAFLAEIPLGSFDRVSTSAVAAVVWTLMLAIAAFLVRFGLRLASGASRSVAGFIEFSCGVALICFALAEVLAHEPSVVAMVASRMLPDPVAWRAAWSAFGQAALVIALGGIAFRVLLVLPRWRWTSPSTYAPTPSHGM